MTTDALREEQLRIQALGAAISRRDWHAVEVAHAAIRDEFDGCQRSIAAPATGGGWMPIETAPKVADEGFLVAGYGQDNPQEPIWQDVAYPFKHWIADAHGERLDYARWWMPLPPAPETEG